MDSDSTTWIEWAQVVGATAGVVIAGLVAFMPYVRRPRLTIKEDLDTANSRVEASAMGGLPHVRLLVANAKRRRAAQGTRVLVEGYTRAGSELTTLGHPSLDWPSAGEAAASAAVTVFAGGARPITLGYFIRVRREQGRLLRPHRVDPQGTPMYTLPHYARPRDYDDGDAEGWYFKLALAFGLDINDDRDKLPPVEEGYIVRLVVGADDGAARAFKVHLNWDGDPGLTPEQVLESALRHLAVTK
jgi:hypothetical protein